MEVSLARPSCEMWISCVNLVRARYASAFAADVSPNPDAFLAGSVASDAAPSSVIACMGLTFGSQKQFFSERYLDDNLETSIRQHFGKEPDRHRIVEVGALAADALGSGHELVRVAPLILWCMGMHYALCTATVNLRRKFHQLKIPFVPFGSASKTRLTPSEQDRWGRYYDTQPLTGVVPLNDIASLFSDYIGRYAFADPQVTLLSDHRPEHQFA